MDLDRLVFSGVLPVQAIGRGVQRLGADGVGLGQLVACVQQHAAQVNHRGWVGEIRGQFPTVGVAEVLVLQRNVFLDGNFFPKFGVAVVGARQIQQRRGRSDIRRKNQIGHRIGGDVLEHATGKTLFGKVVRHADLLRIGDLGCTLAADMVHRAADKAVHTAGQAERGVVRRVHAHGVARLELGLALGIAVKTGFGSRVGGGIKRCGRDAGLLQLGPRHGRALGHAGRDGAHLQAGFTGVEVGVVGTRQHVGVNAVERQRQANGHADAGAATGQGGGQCGGARHGVDGRPAFTAQVNAIGADLCAVGGAAHDAGVDAAVNTVFCKHAGRTHGLGAAHAGAHGG